MIRSLEGIKHLATLPKELGAPVRIGMLPDNIVVVACENGACLVYANGNTQILWPGADDPDKPVIYHG